MKKLLGWMMLTVAAQANVALAEDQKAVIFEDTYLERGYTAFGVRSANVLGDAQAFAGVLGGWHFSDRFVFGVRADALVSQVDVDVTDSKRLGITQLGLFGEYEVYAKDLFSFSAGLGAGSGDVGYKVEPKESSVTVATSSETQYVHDSFTFIEPEVTAAMHVSHRVDVALSVGFRSIRGFDLDGLGGDSKNGGMNGSTASLMMRGNF